MKGRIFIDFSNKSGGSIDEIFFELHKCGFMEKYFVVPIGDPVSYFRSNFLDEVSKRGFQSFLSFTLAMDDITCKSMHIDDIERVFHNFIKNLYPAKKLIIIDSYFLNKNGIKDSAKLFVKLIKPILADLCEIVIVTKEESEESLSIMRSELSLSAAKDLIIKIKLSDDFHDRFWINPESMQGLVVGTSLNGIGKKISLVDKISSNDVASILKLLPS
jgi:hypothetical protein